MEDPAILVVEDEGIIAKSIQAMLTGMGFRVSATVSSGEEAIQKAEELQPDLVLMDIVLGGKMDGIEAAEQFHARFDIPVVYLTAYADSETIERAKLTNPYGYVVKPFSESELHAAIELALYKHMMERKPVSRGGNKELDLALRALVEHEGVTAAAVISREGMLLQAYGNSRLMAGSPLLSMAAMMVRMAEKCARLLNAGELTVVVADSENNVILVEKYDGFILLMVVNHSIKFDDLKQERERVRRAVKGIV
jgi:CheY-like chemotaxis protein/predicted regulator of Ras-like GTPase activity (Roadblock/LC7/MglB family)